MFNIFKRKPLNKVAEIELSKNNKNVFIDEFYSKRIPVVIKGGAKDWPLFSKWTKEYIVDVAPGQLCTIVEDSRPAYAKEQTTLKFFFEKLKGKGTLTLTDYDKKKIPAFLKDIPLPNLLFKKNDLYRYFFFYAPENAGTLPHNHGDAFNVLASGTKEWLFYDACKVNSPNGQKEMLKTFEKYPIGSFANNYFSKELNSLNKKVDDLTICTQEAGDIVYVPRDYSHAVLNKSDVMGVVFETKLLN